jgi:rhomboid protease GluP
VRAALLDERPPAVTKLLLYANIGVFLIGMVVAQQRAVSINDYLFMTGPEVNRVRHDIGSMHPEDVLRGQWWRLLSCTFVHIGVLHLAMNMYALYVLGPLLERMWGRWRYLLVYLVAGLVGSCTPLYVHNPAGLAGASGALCGLLGSMGVWVLLNKRYLPETIASGLMRNVMINVILITIISLPGPWGFRVSWEGHLGGAIGGALISLPLTFSRFGVGAQRPLGWAGAAAVPVLAQAATGFGGVTRQAQGAYPEGRGGGRQLCPGVPQLFHHAQPRDGSGIAEQEAGQRHRRPAENGR